MCYLLKWKTKPKPPQKPLFQSYISGFLWYRKMYSYCEQFGNFGKTMWPCWLLRSVFKSLWKEYVQYSQHIWNERSKCRTSYTELVTSVVLSDFAVANIALYPHSFSNTNFLAFNTVLQNNYSDRSISTTDLIEH